MGRCSVLGTLLHQSGVRAYISVARTPGIFIFAFICPAKLLHFKCILGKSHSRGTLSFVRNLVPSFVLKLMDIIAYLPLRKERKMFVSDTALQFLQLRAFKWLLLSSPWLL